MGRQGIAIHLEPALFFSGYTLLGVICRRFLTGKLGEWSFAFINVFGAAVLSSFADADPFYLGRFFAGYTVLVSMQFVLLKWAKQNETLFRVAFLFPVLIFLMIRGFQGASYFVGLPYMALRLSHFAVESKSSPHLKYSFPAFVSYAFFVPTLQMGPISPYQIHSGPEPTPQPLNYLLRTAFGYAKLVVLGSIFIRHSYGGLPGGMAPITIMQLFSAACYYYLYLYCIFSGLCDIAVGIAGLLGTSVAENFNRPFIARNIKDFWNRWHISLSLYMKAVVFLPLNKALMRRFSARRAHFANTITILVLFLLIGVWHGASGGYILFGLIHAIGVILNLYYLLLLRRVLSKRQLEAYNKSRLVEVCAITATFLYVTASFFFFANDMTAIRDILGRVL